MSRKRYTSDLTDTEWGQLAPLIPPAKPGGRPRTIDTRQTCSETSNVGGSGLSLYQCQAESDRLFAHRSDLTGTDPLALFLGAQITKRGAMGEQVIDDARDLVGRGDND
jgi:hypothetical protein